MIGHSHYVTFDGQNYDYTGTCAYTFLEPCSGTFPPPYGYISVRARNRRIEENG